MNPLAHHRGTIRSVATRKKLALHLSCEDHRGAALGRPIRRRVLNKLLANARIEVRLEERRECNATSGKRKVAQEAERCIEEPVDINRLHLHHCGGVHVHAALRHVRRQLLAQHRRYGVIEIEVHLR